MIESNIFNLNKMIKVIKAKSKSKNKVTNILENVSLTIFNSFTLEIISPDVLLLA